MNTRRKMTGFLATLTPEQKKRALAYRGPDTFPSPLPLERGEMSDEERLARDIAKDAGDETMWRKYLAMAGRVIEMSKAKGLKSA